MTRPAGPDEGASKALGQFLQQQSRAAGLTAREIEERFRLRADQEQAQIAGGQAPPADPVSSMNFSKSHLDRLFKGATSPPSKRFVMMFLEITSSAAGVNSAHHQQLCRKAHDLLSALHQYRRHARIKNSTVATPAVPPEAAVATLQLQVELERAHRFEDRLRWALSDSQILMTTLLQIISSLREIIIELDTKHTQALHLNTESPVAGSTEDLRLQAATQKATAESQLARVNERRILLESLWGQAHANVHSLSKHPDIPKIETLPTGPALPQLEILSMNLSTHPALDDIAAALTKAERINIAEDRKTHEWQESLAPATDLESVDEQAILLAATRLSDDAARMMALVTLTRSWPDSPTTRDVLLRLSRDEESEIRRTATQILGKYWSSDDSARQAVIERMRDVDSKVQALAVWVLTENWQGDVIARDAVVALALDGSEEARETAVEGLAEGWPDDETVRDVLVRLTCDEASHLRQTAVEILLERWPGDVTAQETLINLLQSDDVSMREAAAASLYAGWPGEASVTAAFHELQHDSAALIRWIAERALAQEGQPLENLSAEQRNREDTFQAEQPANTTEHGTLIGSRVPYDFSTERPLEAVWALRRVMSFDPGINVISGANASGKTILMMALALKVGATEWRKLVGHYAPRLAREIAEHLELLWNGEPVLECFYLNINSPERERVALLEDALSTRSKYRLYLLDEPLGAYDLDSTKAITAKMEEIAKQGSQFIISTANAKRYTFVGAKQIRLGRHRIRERGTFLSW
ncbi:HEAT repeat domain-containing protein [Streptomyces sp. NPDC005402]|uniref:HEAT repeat domain-containing protein n=1 Tax=Streptomyces sp. NPDC005402 TaxID=3155338 RepID=UPI0033AF14F2